MAFKKGGREQASLRDFQAALHSAAESLPPLVAASGECEYLRSRAVAAFRSAWLNRYPDGDIIVFRTAGEARPVGFVDVAGELSGGSLFAREKLVIVRQAERLLFPVSGKTAADDARPAAASGTAGREAAFVACLDAPGPRMWLLLECAQVPKNRTLGKKVAETCFPIPCPQPVPREIPGWLSEGAAGLGKTIDSAAVDQLTRSYGVDLGILSAELEKLALFSGDNNRIDAAMVGEFLTGTVEFDIFNFTNAVEARDSARAVYYARRIVMQGTRDQKGKREAAESSSHKVLSMLAGTVQGLLRARVAKARGLDAAAFAAAEKLSPWRAEKLLDAAARFGLRELRLMARYAADQLRRSHDTGGDAMLSLELMAVRFTGVGFDA